MEPGLPRPEPLPPPTLRDLLFLDIVHHDRSDRYRFRRLPPHHYLWDVCEEQGWPFVAVDRFTSSVRNSLPSSNRQAYDVYLYLCCRPAFMVGWSWCDDWWVPVPRRFQAFNWLDPSRQHAALRNPYFGYCLEWPKMDEAVQGLLASLRDCFSAVDSYRHACDCLAAIFANNAMSANLEPFTALYKELRHAHP